MQEANYRGYWIAWLILLVITVVMVALTNPAVLLAGMTVKATIIALWFMHLKFEKTSLIVTVVVASLVTTLILFGLMVPDALAY